MKEFARRIAVVVGAVAVSVGLMSATAAPAQAIGNSTPSYDSSWGR